MMARFYRDFGIPEVERLARACCTARGQDPDEEVQETGYDDAVKIPRWWFHQSSAFDFLVMTAALSAPTPEQTGGE